MSSRECGRQIDDLGRRATRNKRLTYLATLTTMVSGAAIPVLLLLSTQTAAFVFGKLLPAVLAAVAVVAAGSTQVVRPRDRWRAYRREQRLLEADRIAYVHRAGEYASLERDRVFIERVILSRRSILDQWLELTPETATARSALGSCRGRAKKAADACMRGSSDGRLGTSPLASAIRLRDALLPVTVRTMARRSRSAAAQHSRIRCPVLLTPCVLSDEHEALRVRRPTTGPAHTGPPKGFRRSFKDERHLHEAD